MTDKEQIEEITKIINRRCEAELGQVHANSKDGKVTKTVGTSLIAKDIINAGYHKTVWHKVADGDLPKRIGDIIMAIKFNDCIITITGRYRLYDFYISDIGRIEKEKVIAWAELPKYEEVENE